MPLSRHRRKKSKGPVPKINTPKGKKGFFKNALDVFLIIVVVALLTIANRFDKNILFFPFSYYVYAGIPLYIVILYIDWDGLVASFNEMVSFKNIILFPYRLCLYVTAAFILAYILTIPLNYYIKESSKNNPIETYRCSITSIFIKYRRRSDRFTAYYQFKNDTLGHSVSRTKAEELKENDTYKKYYVHLEVRKGPFDTYVIQNWEHRLKPIL